MKHCDTIFHALVGLLWIPQKSVGASYVELVFLHLVGFVCHVVYSGAFEARNIDTLFFILRWDRYGFHKKRAGTYYAEHVLLHLVRSVCHVVQSGASMTQNIDALFFLLRWDRYRFHKKHGETLVFLHLVGYVCHVVHSGASMVRNIDTIFHTRVGLVQIPQKSSWDTLRRTSVFASSVICGSHSAF
jgi:hypothetical protein